MTSIPAPAPGLAGVARKEPFCGVPGSIISSEEGSTTWSRQLCHGLLHAPLIAITHTTPGERGPHPHTQSHTQDRSAGSQRHQGVLKRLSSGAPCRPDYKEAGWQGRAGLHLLPSSRGRRGGPWAGLGRVLLAAPAGAPRSGSPGTLVQGSWAVASKGCGSPWWPWWWSQPVAGAGTSCTNSSRSRCSR